MLTSDAAAAFSTLADLQRGMAARSGGSGPSGALPLAASRLPLKVERTRTFHTPVEQYVRTQRRIAFRLRGRTEPTEYFRSREPAERELPASDAGAQLTLL